MGLTSGALCQKWLWIGRAAAVLLIVQFNGGCTPKPAEPPDRLLRIVLLARSADSDELPVMKSAALAFMRENKTVSVEVIAPPVQSPEQQRKLLAESASSGAHAICIYPLDPAGISREVNSTVVSGVPIVTIGLDIPNSSRSAYCGPNEAEVGEAAARACSLTMDPWPSRMVIILHGGEEREPYGQRYLAFKNSIGLVKDARILRELNCNGETPEAVRMVALESRKYPRVGAWVLIENWPIPRTPIDPAGWPSQCSVVLCNASPRYFAELRANRISALLGFDVRLAVSKAIQAATWLAQGPRDGGAFDTHMPVEIITRQEVALWEQKWEKWRGPDPGGPAPTATETPGRKSPSS